jgi:ankyrin repeat protein
MRSARAQVPPRADEIARYEGVHAAVAKADAAGLKALLAANPKPDLSKADGHGRTAYHVAAHRGDLAMMRALVKAGADPKAFDSQRYDAITIAAVNNDEAAVRLAIELGGDAKAVTSPYDGTALIAAAHLGHDGVVRALIEAGSPLDHVNNLGWTAVIEAIVLGDGGPRHIACLKALLDAGANPDLADGHGTLPVKLAQGRGFTAMVALIEAKRR